MSKVAICLMHGLFCVLIFSLTFLLFPTQVTGNSPVPGPDILVRLTGNLDEDVTYVDLLVPLAPSSENHTDFNEENGAFYYIKADSPIVRYNQDGYISYTFHCLYTGSHDMYLTYTGASSDRPYRDARFVNAHEIIGTQFKYIKVALLNAAGEVLHVTASIQISGLPNGYFTGWIELNANTYEVVNDGYFRSPLAATCNAIARIAFSVAMEILIAYCFKLRPLIIVVLLNICTQLALTMFMSLRIISYWPSLIIGEAFVYLAEGAAVIHFYRHFSLKRKLLFVAVANTVTLGLGLLFNYVGIFY